MELKCTSMKKNSGLFFYFSFFLLLEFFLFSLEFYLKYMKLLVKLKLSSILLLNGPQGARESKNIRNHPKQGCSVTKRSHFIFAC